MESKNQTNSQLQFYQTFFLVFDSHFVNLNLSFVSNHGNLFYLMESNIKKVPDRLNSVHTKCYFWETLKQVDEGRKAKEKGLQSQKGKISSTRTINFLTESCKKERNVWSCVNLIWSAEPNLINQQLFRVPLNTNVTVEVLDSMKCRQLMNPKTQKMNMKQR